MSNTDEINSIEVLKFVSPMIPFILETNIPFNAELQLKILNCKAKHKATSYIYIWWLLQSFCFCQSDISSVLKYLSFQHAYD